MITAQNWLGIDDSHIVAMSPKHGLQAMAKEAFLAMQDAAAKDGVDIQLVSSFRSYAQQMTIWQAKWSGQRTLLSLDSTPLDFASLTETQRLHSILTWSALPGASRHHWGTDLDVYDPTQVQALGQKFNLVGPEYAQGGPCFELNCWLDSHADDFGFYRPYGHYNGGVAPEPWHLSFKAEADSIIKQLDIAELDNVLAQSDIGGKHIILDNLASLFERYTLNGLDTK